MDIFIYILVFIFGSVIGSFLNVCIYRIPKKEDIVVGRSHCMNCKKTLKWYDMVPVFSFLLLRGKCRFCKTKLSLQYPVIETVNAILYVIVFYIYGWDTTFIILLNIVYCMAISVLVVISVIDYRTFTIPAVLNKTLFVFAVLASIINYFGQNMSIKILMEHVIGFFIVSAFLALVFYISKGRGIGGGDVKLMAVAGLLLGWKLILLAFILGCLFASIIHLIKMLIKNADRTLAFGPYLSAGIIVALLFGNNIINWYIASVLLL